MADNSIAALLANAGQTNADFNFGRINQSYYQGLDEAYKRRTQDAFLNATNDPGLLDDKGNLDPTKMFTRALQVGGVPAAKAADELAGGAYRVDSYRQGAALSRSLDEPRPTIPPSISSTASPRRSSGPTSFADPNDDGSSPTAAPPGPKQATLKDIFAAGGIAPSARNLSEASAAIQLATKQPFDANGPVDLNNPVIRAAIVPFVRALQSPPQVGPPPAPQVQQAAPAGPLMMQTGNQAVGARFPTPQQGGQPAPLPQFPGAPVAAPPGPQTMMLSPEAMDAMAQAPQQQGQQSGLIDPESLRQMIPRDILKAGGGTVTGTLDFLSRVSRSNIPPEQKAPFMKLQEQLTEQLKLNEPQRNAFSSGQPSPLAYDIHKANETEIGKQDIDTFNKRNLQLQTLGQASYDGIEKSKLMKQLTVDPSFYSGPLNQNVQTFNQFKAIFGQNPSSALPQEAFNKVTNDMLTEQIKAMGQSGVGRVLLSEVNSMKASVASLGITPQTNRALAEMVQRVHAKNQHIAEIANSVPQTPGKMNRTLDTQIQNYLKQNPMFAPEEIKNPSLLGAPDTPPGSEKWSPEQARGWAARIGLKPGDPIRLNGKIRAVP